jgi:diguanylate cyclase (GGDEF)-like protein
MVAGGTAVGVLAVWNDPPLSDRDRRALAAAAAVVAIAVRNVQLLRDTREQSLIDGLTGCFNRAHGIDSLEKELRRARRAMRPLSLIMFDIDEFKKINDGRGHLQGDALLAAVGAELVRVLRSTDIRCRYGGDEFMIILPDTPLLGAEQVAEGLRREIADLKIAGASGTFSVTASIGVGVAAAGELDAKALIARVDMALYDAKRSGRNRFSVATPAPSRPASTDIVAGPTLPLAQGK